MILKLGLSKYLLLLFVFISFKLIAQKPPTPDSIKRISLEEIRVEKRLTRYAEVLYIDSLKLRSMQSRSLGETLDNIPGIHNSNYGPYIGMPSIRSLSGNRVGILHNGVAANDLSGISPNLGVQVDFDNIESITLYKSGANVLYGGKAIGGAVNLIDQTIPKYLNGAKIKGSLHVEAGTNEGHKQSVRLTGQIGKHWGWHFGGMNYKNDRFKIPGNPKPALVYDSDIDPGTENLAQVIVNAKNVQNVSLYPYLSQYVIEKMKEPDHGLSEEDLYTDRPYSVIGGVNVQNPNNDKFIAGQPENTPRYVREVYGIRDYHPVEKGMMPNSHGESKAINLGTSFIYDNFRIGLGLKANEGYFGVPAFAKIEQAAHNHDHDAPAKAAIYSPINTRSLNYEGLFESAYQPIHKLIKKVTVNYSFHYGDNRELLDIYKVNQFNSRRHAIRSELELQSREFWKSTSGIEYMDLSMLSEGLMRYLPNVESRETGIFTLHQFKYHAFQIDLGYRSDWTDRSAHADADYKTSRGLAGGNLRPRSFQLNQFTSALQWQHNSLLQIRLSYNHAERAPGVNELYAGNNHFAIITEENGDDRLNPEIANSVEAEAKLNYLGFSLVANIYHSHFNNYIYLAHTGLSNPGGFVKKEWRASDTEISGFEMTLQYLKRLNEQHRIQIEGFADLVKNKNTSDDEMRKWAEGDYMPNLPTSRYGMQARADIKRLNLNASFTQFMKQKYLGKNINLEKAMPAYAMLSAQIGYLFPLRRYQVVAFVSGNNLLNVEARPQNSPLKYLTPLPGRNLSAGLRINI
ncbi:TonB-dependent receptor [Sphingobacterium sp. BN32]|uniref:TonB-dependent receptor n=1 Tax=Sphingobacterium sp. BN32 TaxID=3058432 RepID=UPI00265CA661|nr:TonB-dependent receptor [Sphingobacterium sp. BN32]WKK57783.1 TonB-dependent receptor [Sphingobacterium sp. BN32]